MLLMSKKVRKDVWTRPSLLSIKNNNGLSFSFSHSLLAELIYDTFKMIVKNSSYENVRLLERTAHRRHGYLLRTANNV